MAKIKLETTRRFAETGFVFEVGDEITMEEERARRFMRRHRGRIFARVVGLPPAKKKAAAPKATEE